MRADLGPRPSMRSGIGDCVELEPLEVVPDPVDGTEARPWRRATGTFRLLRHDLGAAPELVTVHLAQAVREVDVSVGELESSVAAAFRHVASIPPRRDGRRDAPHEKVALYRTVSQR